MLDLKPGIGARSSGGSLSPPPYFVAVGTRWRHLHRPDRWLSLGPGRRLHYFSFGSVLASSAAMMWYPGVRMWMLKVPSQKYVKVQTRATGTGI